MKAWFGLLYLGAALKLSTTDTDIVWYHESNNDIFSVTMQQKRFTFLTRVVQINDAETCKERWNHDEFTVFREFFEAVNRRSRLHIWGLMKFSIPTMEESNSSSIMQVILPNMVYSSEVCMI